MHTVTTQHPRAAVLALAIVLVGSCLAPQALGQPIGTRRVASGLSSPLYVTAPPADLARLFIVEKAGLIKILDLNTRALREAPFLDLTTQTSKISEQGLLGLAFHPDYANNGLFFVHFTNLGGDNFLRRYRVSADPDVADPGSAMDLLTIDQPQANHNGGWIGFGRDGYLYVGIGDGGGGDDNDAGHTPGTGNGQDITDNLLGKMLRIDVNGDDFPADANRNYAIPPDNPFVDGPGDDEIWAYGLRNPWRSSFDRATGDLYIGDVGQGSREEVNVQPAGSPGGQNYGWRLREGTIATPTGGVGGPRPAGAIDPIYNYPHGSGPFQGNSVTGGYVYRGPILELRGQYIFGDYSTGHIWSLRYDGSDPSTFDGTNYTDLTDRTAQFTPDVGSIGNVSSFGEDARGNLYIVDYGGEVFRVVGPLAGDVDDDGDVDALDVIATVNAFGSTPEDPAWNGGADHDGNGMIDVLDVIEAVDNFGDFLF